MRFHWIVTFLSFLFSMGLLVVIIGQRHELTMTEQRAEKLKAESKRLDDEHINEDFFKATLEKVLQGRKKVENLEILVANLVSEIEEKKRKGEACLAETKAFNDVLEKQRKEDSEVKALLKAESEAWEAEIKTLTAQLQGYRPACDYVKNNTIAAKRCGPKPVSNEPPHQRR